MRAVVLSSSGRTADPWHPYDATSAELAGLAREAGFDVEIVDGPLEGLAALDDATRLVIVNAGDPDGPLPDGADDPGPADERLVARAAAGLEAALARGIGLFVAHSALSTLRELPAYGDAIGARWIDGVSWHPPIGDARVQVVGDHPIAAGQADFTVFDERYTGMPLTGDIEPIAVHAEAGANHPLVWARRVGASRIVVDALGHDARSYESAEHRRLVRSALAWLGAVAEPLSATEGRPRVTRVVIAPDSFKGTVTAADAAAAIARGWSGVAPDDELVLRPMADGGEGTLDALAAAVAGAVRIPITVQGPDDRPVETSWLRLPGADGAGDTAVVELAMTSGITLLDPLRPLDAHTLGFGQAIAAALDAGVARLLLAIGGSSSTDGGVGALTALGARFLDAYGRPIRRGNRGLGALATVDLSGLRPLPVGGVQVLSDVTSPLLGESGAAAVFGPQKGASAEMIEVLESNLARLARMVLVPESAPGSGAAGGTGFGLLAWGATMAGGASAVADAIGLDAALARADLVVTGEGRFDGQSEAGKAPTEVAGRAAAAGVRVALVAGAITAATDRFATSVSLSDLAGDSAAAMAEPVRWLELAGARLGGFGHGLAELG